MDDKIQIGCPTCGSILSVRSVPGMETKNVTCPVCKKTFPFTRFKVIEKADEDEHTRYPGEEDHGETEVNRDKNYTLGRLYVPVLGLSFQLGLGKNIIGRKASGSAVPIQIPCQTKRMSREHLVIEIKKVLGQGFVHYVSLNKEQVNPTYIGNCQLEYGDKIVLKHNDIIKLPDMEIRFEIPDEEGTELS